MLKVLNGWQNNNRFRSGREGESFLRLFISKQLIQGAAAALLTIFLPIFLYEVSDYNFLAVGSLYAAVYLLYVLLLAPSMRLVNRIGFSRALVIGGFFWTATNLLLFFITPENVSFLLLPVMAMLVGYFIFHWVPYHVDFALFSTRQSRNQQVSMSMATVAFMGVIGPILGGFIVMTAGYQVFFAVVVLLACAATISYAFVPETGTLFEWSVRETWYNFFDRKKRNLVIGEYANGAETVVNVIVWPIFLFEILDGNLLEVGAVSTIVVAATIIVQLVWGKYLDAHSESQRQTLQIGSTLYAIGWIIKMFVISTLQVFVVGLYHNLMKIFTKTPFTSIVYDISAGQGKYVDEFTVLREMAHNLGRASSLIVISFITIFVSITWAFVIAAAASIALNLVHYTVKN